MRFMCILMLTVGCGKYAPETKHTVTTTHTVRGEANINVNVNHDITVCGREDLTPSDRAECTDLVERLSEILGSDVFTNNGGNSNGRPR